MVLCQVGGEFISKMDTAEHIMNTRVEWWFGAHNIVDQTGFPVCTLER